MSAAAEAPRAGRAAPLPTALDRVAAALPLAALYLTACTVYAWQAWRVSSPWIFTDELQYTDISRSVAESGEYAIRGAPWPLDTLAPVLMAPAWLLHDVSQAYDVAKYLNVFVMCATLFPAYGLARMVAGRGASLAAAVATVTSPALFYSGLLLEEPLAWFWSTTSLFVLVRALSTRSPGWLLLLAGTAGVAPFVRGELVVIPGIAVLAAGIYFAPAGARLLRARAGLPAVAAAGAAVLLLGAAAAWLAAGHAAVAHAALVEEPGRTLRYGLWGAGAFVIGVGVLPAVVALASLVPGRADAPRPFPADRAFRATLLAAIAAYLVYAGSKIAYLSVIWNLVVVPERNLIYLAPLCFVATARWLDGARLRPEAIAAAVLAVALLLRSVPIHLDYPYFEAPGYSVLTWANRSLFWTQDDLRAALLVLVAASAAVALGAWLLERRPGPRLALASAALAGVVALNVTGEWTAAAGSADFGSRIVSSTASDPRWVDGATRGQPAVFVGTGAPDQNPYWTLEFWNRSLQRVSMVDGSLLGPGVSPPGRIASPAGDLAGAPALPYALTSATVTMQGRRVASSGQFTVWRVRGPLRVRSVVTGTFPDGWTGPRASYDFFGAPGARGGTLAVTVGRAGWGGAGIGTDVSLAVGRLELDPLGGRTLREPVSRVAWKTDATGGQRTFLLQTPPPPFRVELDSATFVPAAIDPTLADARALGVRADFRYRPERLPGLRDDGWTAGRFSWERSRCRRSRLTVMLGSDPHLFRSAQVVTARSGRVTRRVSVPPAGEAKLTVPVRPGAGGGCVVRFAVGRTAVPAQVVRGSTDRRVLGVRVTGIDLRPAAAR